MFYHLFVDLADRWAMLNVFRYITFRTLGAAITAFWMGVLLGPWMIERLRVLKAGQSIRDDGPETHLQKAGTPTMGGVLILAAIFVPTLLWARLDTDYVWIVLGVTAVYGALGFADDYLKVKHKNSKGVPGKVKLLVQTAGALAAGAYLYYSEFGTDLAVPFFKDFDPDLGIVFIPFVILVIVGASNAVNLTDGLDGLAIGPVITTTATYTLFAYIAGNAVYSEYLLVPSIPGVGELCVVCAAAVGAGLAFLWFNSYPAEVFMGDVGSLALGGLIGTVAVLTKQEILLALVGGIFVVETLSVMIQVFWFKRTGERVFKMAPLHHHYELLGWPEPKVIVRFWIISIILALAGVSTLKLR
ncbi:MAG: phospho-N-acetylmuramoyl-pentapeptide-transferase [Chrysiogenetes bacterium]|nr:phospho-N-acetylmuramoyl-pentapeptide-transferase [Chrysiogenetes bacterium]